nr:reverse transcriptase domain-containing protein [Tanacetum cinerariifolium]
MEEIEMEKMEMEKIEMEEMEMPFNFNGTKGVVGLTRWFEKMETVFNISNCPEKYQDKVKRFIGGFPDNIQGNVIAAEPTKLQDAICIANTLMDQRLKVYARSAKDKKRDYTLGLLGHSFDIDLIPIELGSFDIIIGMDWLVKYHALIVCDEKVVHVPYRNEVLIIRGNDCDDRSKLKLNIISCTKTQKYIQKGCQVYLAQVTSKKAEDKSKEKRLEDVPIVREILEVFPEDSHRLPPDRQVEFQIDLVPGAATVGQESTLRSGYHQLRVRKKDIPKTSFRTRYGYYEFQETMIVEESLNVKLDESPPPISPPLEDDDILECEETKDEGNDGVEVSCV